MDRAVSRVLPGRASILPLHHKFAVFDGYTVITGSYNWYEPSLYSDEVLTVTRDRAIAGAFLDEAELLLRCFRIERA
jgi:phosphatidylserine/phosphatidylglycerophosphate/cardiolipin synthase-like enzyme